MVQFQILMLKDQVKKEINHKDKIKESFSFILLTFFLNNHLSSKLSKISSKYFKLFLTLKAN